MINLTDIIILILFAYFFSAGWSKGLIRTIFGPISLMLGGILGMLFYFYTQDAVLALAISILAPFAIYFLVSTYVKFWQKANETDKEMFSFGRLFGGLLSLFWRGTILIMMVILIVFLPQNIPYLDGIQNNITQSQTYQMLTNIIGEKTQAATDTITSLVDGFEDPERLEELQQSEAYQKLMENEKVQALFSELLASSTFSDENTEPPTGENVMQSLPEILSNPHFKEILQDKDLLQQFFDVQKEMMKMKEKIDY